MVKRYLDRNARDVAIEQSLDAALALDELLRGVGDSSSAIEELKSTLVGAENGIDQLVNNSQTANLYRRAYSHISRPGASEATTTEIASVLKRLLDLNINTASKEQLALIRDFCLGLNQELVSEAFRRVPEPPLARTSKRELAAVNVNW